MNTIPFALRTWGLCYLLAALFSLGLLTWGDDAVRVHSLAAILFLLGAAGLFMPRRLAGFLTSRKSLPILAALLLLGFVLEVLPIAGLGVLLVGWKVLLWCLGFWQNSDRALILRLPVLCLYWGGAVVGHILLFEEVLFAGIDSDGLIITAIVDAGVLAVGARLFSRNLDLISGGGPSFDRELVAAELAARLEVGMTTAEALRGLYDLLDSSPVLRRISNACKLGALADQVEQGTHLSDAMRRTAAFPDYWPRLLDLCHSTALPAALRQLALLESRKRPMLGARTTFIVLTVILMATFNFTYVMGGLYEMVEATGGRSTLLVVGRQFQNFCESGFLLIIAGGLLVGLSWFPDFRNRIMRMVSSRLYPSGLARLSQRAQLTESLAGLIKLGLPTTAALEIASQALQRRQLREELRTAAHRGAGFSELAAEFPQIFPPQVRFLIEAGERTGRLTEALEAVARLQSEEFEVAEQKARVKLDVGATLVAGLLTLLATLLTLAPHAHLITLGFEDVLLP